VKIEKEPITGNYGNFKIDGVNHRIYWEEAGEGVPLVCLHTAGSDGRQYRALLNDKKLLKKFRVIVFDMPWHGKSSPPENSQVGHYKLSTETYISQIMSFIDGLELVKPVVMGCSIGGRIILHLAIHFPEKFRALIGLQSAGHIDPYYDISWLHRQDVHGGEVCGGIAYGLMAPTSPDNDKFETMWHYMQGGPGIFKGDLFFYKFDGNIGNEIKKIDNSICPIYLLTGEYDYSATPEETKSLADTIGIEMIKMKNVGHFPMSENPKEFLKYLHPVLEKIN
jgi:pimeloyl-ACP methyl ester carboxylesterase